MEDIEIHVKGDDFVVGTERRTTSQKVQFPLTNQEAVENLESAVNSNQQTRKEYVR
jgi:hypothetical protein